MYKTILITFITLTSACCNQKAPNDISINDAWVREAPPNAMMMAGYATIKNNTDQDRTLTFAKSEQFKMVEIHKTIVVDGVAKMRRQDNLVIPAGDSLELKPGSYHLMLMHPQSALKLDDEVTVTVGMKQGDSVEELDIILPIRKAN